MSTIKYQRLCHKVHVLKFWTQIKTTTAHFLFLFLFTLFFSLDETNAVITRKVVQPLCIFDNNRKYCRINQLDGRLNFKIEFKLAIAAFCDKRWSAKTINSAKVLSCYILLVVRYARADFYINTVQNCSKIPKTTVKHTNKLGGESMDCMAHLLAKKFVKE